MNWAIATTLHRELDLRFLGCDAKNVRPRWKRMWLICRDMGEMIPQ
jgi:hypothetical protein